MSIHLGVNVDHVATLRQARLVDYPSPLQAALMAEAAGADNITFHLREDRRHIQDADVYDFKKHIHRAALNFECALDPQIIDMVCEIKPEFCCLVPEKREELTTEGGLDVVKHQAELKDTIARLHSEGIHVSLFVDAAPTQLEASAALGVKAVELHTGDYANLAGEAQAAVLKRLFEGARLAHELGLWVHAGHGLTTENVRAITQMPHLRELNIGHAIIAKAVFVGLTAAVQEMKQLLSEESA